MKTLIALLLVPTAVPALAPDRYDAGHRLCRFTDARINESSGVASSSFSDTVVWTHDDSGDTNRFFAVDLTTGATLATYAADLPALPPVQKESATALDIEDIARGVGVDGKPALFLGDIGDNPQVQAVHTVYEYAEPTATVPAGSTPLTAQPLPVTQHKVTFAGALPSDEESLAVLPDRRLVIVTKPRGTTDLEYTGKSLVYESLTAMGGTDALVMQQVGAIDFTVLTGVTTVGADDIAATAADITQDGRKLVVRTYTTAFEWLVGADEDLGAAVATAPTRIPLLPTKQGEGIGYSLDQKSLLTTSEGDGTAADSPAGGVVDRYDSLADTPAPAMPDGQALLLVGVAGAAAGGVLLRARRSAAGA